MINDHDFEPTLEFELTEKPSKECSACRLRYPLDGFNRDSGRMDGLQARCRACDNARSQEYNASYQQEHGVAVRTAWERENRERSRAYQRARYARVKADADPTKANDNRADRLEREYCALLAEHGAVRRRNHATSGPMPPILTDDIAG